MSLVRTALAIAFTGLLVSGLAAACEDGNREVSPAPTATAAPAPTAPPKATLTATPTSTPTPTATPTASVPATPTLTAPAPATSTPRAQATPTPTPAASASVSGSAALDRAALVALYEATGGPDWWNTTNWLTDRPLGEWYGVTTDGDGRVTDLGLYHNQLDGPIPPELVRLSNLRELHLYDNQLDGPIPPELGGLTNLRELYLYFNELSGPIPAELGGLTNLRHLSLHDNQLSGAIPVDLGQLVALTHVYLADNALTGCVPTSLRSVSNNDVGSLGLEDCSTGTYLDPVPEAIDVGEELTFGVITDVEAPSTIRIGPGAGNAAVSINEEACPSAPALSEGGGVSYHYRDDPRFRSSGAVYLRGCAAGTTEIHIYQGTTLLQSYPVRVTERTLVALSDGAAGELVLTWSDGTVGASTATGWQYRLRIWGREGDAPDGDAPRTWGEWTTIPGDGMVRRHRVTGLDEEWPYDFEVRPVTTAGPGLPSNIGEGVTARVGRDGIPRLNVPNLTATGFGWGGGVYGDQVLEGGRTYRLGDSDSVITIPAGMNMTVGLVGNDHLAGLIFSLEDVVTGNWVTLEFAFREVERSVAPVEDGGGTAPDPNTLFDQMLNSIRVQPEPPAGGE